MKLIIFYKIKNKFLNIDKQWDSMATNEIYVEEYAHKHINPEPEKWMSDYKIQYGLAEFGEIINKQYRSGNITVDNQKYHNLLKQYNTDIDLVLYRGIHKEIYKLMKQNARYMKDCDLYEKGFMSTSLVKGHEFNTNIKLRIYVPANTNVIYHGNINNELDLYEVVIMCGAKLKIISIDKTYINCKLISTM